MFKQNLDLDREVANHIIKNKKNGKVTFFLGKGDVVEGIVNPKLFIKLMNHDIGNDIKFTLKLQEQSGFNDHARDMKLLENGILNACDNYAGIADFLGIRSKVDVRKMSQNKISCGRGYLLFLEGVKEEVHKRFSKHIYFCSLIPNNGLMEASEENLKKFKADENFYERQIERIIDPKCKWNWDNFDPTKAKFTTYVTSNLMRRNAIGATKAGLNTVYYGADVYDDEDENFIELISYEIWDRNDTNYNGLLKDILDELTDEEAILLMVVGQYRILKDSGKTKLVRTDFVNKVMNCLGEKTYTQTALDTAWWRLMNKIKKFDFMSNYVDDLERIAAYDKKQDEKKKEIWETKKATIRNKVRTLCGDDALSLYDFIYENDKKNTSNFIQAIYSKDGSEFKNMVKVFIKNQISKSQVEDLKKYCNLHYETYEEKKKFIYLWSCEYLSSNKHDMTLLEKVSDLYREIENEVELETEEQYEYEFER